jgi:lipoate-protein ligase A
MLLVDYHFTKPEENLSCDEVLLNFCDADDGPDLLRFWESPLYFVVLGYTKSLQKEVNIAECKRQQIPILRRCSGGGTVVQGKGCLNYSLISKIPSEEFPHQIPATNCRVMKMQRDALRGLLPGDVEICGHTDLTWNGLKFSGNAQRRKSRYFLFHGTILLDFDIDLVQKVLLMPEVQPAYRDGRSHQSFMTNLPLDKNQVQTAIATNWNVDGKFDELPLEQIETLATEKYLSPQWNEKF